MIFDVPSDQSTIIQAVETYQLDRRHAHRTSPKRLQRQIQLFVSWLGLILSTLNERERGRESVRISNHQINSPPRTWLQSDYHIGLLEYERSLSSWYCLRYWFNWIGDSWRAPLQMKAVDEQWSKETNQGKKPRRIFEKWKRYLFKGLKIRYVSGLWAGVNYTGLNFTNEFLGKEMGSVRLDL